MWNSWKKPQKPAGRFAAVEELCRKQLELKNNHSSLLFFTVHKAASSFAAQLLHRVARDHDIHTMDFDAYLNAVPPSDEDAELRPTLEAVYQSDCSASSAELQSQLQSLYLPQGCLYAPIRRPTLLSLLENLNDYVTIVLLRDPRDCLTSLYFSLAYSHRPPANAEALPQFYEHREQVRQQEIDDFVIAEAPRWLERYTHYCQALERHPRVHLLTYEQLVLDFPTWVDQLAEIWELTFSRRLRNRLFRLANFDVENEDIYSHKRQVLPGDHRRKLKPETIKQVTEIFRPVLVPLGYSLDSDEARAA